VPVLALQHTKYDDVKSESVFGFKSDNKINENVIAAINEECLVMFYN